MKQLNNNSVWKIASMLSPQNRQKLASASRDLLRALPPPSVVRYQSMVHPHRKRKRAISPVRNTGRLRNHPKYKQIRNKYREILLRGNLDNEPYAGITANNIAKTIDRELFHGARTVARTNSMKTDFENMMYEENTNHAKKLTNQVYDLRTGIRKMFTPIGTSLEKHYQSVLEANLKRALKGSSRPRPQPLHGPWHVRLTSGDLTTYMHVWNLIKKIVMTQSWNTVTLRSISEQIAYYFGENGSQKVSAAAKKIVGQIVDEHMRQRQPVL